MSTIRVFGYLKIFRFRQVQNNKQLGLSERATISRKRRNLVSLKFNFFTWLLETASISVVFLSAGDQAKILYIFCVSCGTPLLYFIGIEENRRAAEEYIKANIRVFHKKDKKDSEAECRASGETGGTSSYGPDTAN